MEVNLVELVFPEDSAWDQACRFGHRVDGHAVYCHCPESKWPDAPRKCMRTWCTGGQVKDEDCPGFEASPKERSGGQNAKKTHDAR